MLRVIAVLASCAVLSSALQSPHADDVEKLVNSGQFSVRFSDNILEDARLDGVIYFLMIPFRTLF